MRVQAGRELGLSGETLHDAAQLLDRAGCLGLLPAATPTSSSSDGAATDGAPSPVAPPDVALVGAALLIACKSRACLAWRSAHHPAENALSKDARSWAAARGVYIVSL